MQRHAKNKCNILKLESTVEFLEVDRQRDEMINGKKVKPFVNVTFHIFLMNIYQEKHQILKAH